MSLTGKVALVTGAASGIDKAIALELGRQGAGVVVNYHSDNDPGQPVVDEITAGGGQAVAIQADVSKAADVSRLFAQAVAAYLASDAASYITGTTLFIDGGLMHQTASL